MSDCVNLSEVSKIYSGGTPSRSNLAYWNGDIPWIKTTHIQGNKITQNDVDEFITKRGLDSSSAKIAPAGTILMAMYGQGKTRGQVSVLNIDASINQACCAIEVKPNHCSEYIFQYLKSNYENIRRLSNEGSQKNLNAEIIKNFKIYLPPYREQKAIANILQTWDTAIEKTEALIAAKERQFAWLATRLFNKQNRYLEKMENHFEESIVIEKGKPLVKNEVIEGNIPVIAGGKVSPYSHNTYTHSMPCVTVSGSGAYAGFVSYHDSPIWASDCNVIYSKKHSTEYLYFVLKAKQPQIYALQSGGGQPHVYARDIGSISVPLPPVVEQKRIVSRLSTARQEIKLLKKLGEQYRSQKRGLMQKLLTGKWRITK